MELSHFPGNDKGGGHARAAGAARTAYAVHVAFRVLRHIKIVHVGDAADVQPAGRHISRHQNVDGIFLELTDDGVALCLRQIAVDALRRIAALLQRFRHFVGAALRPYEYDGQIRFLHVEETAQRIKFLTVRQLDVFLLDEVDGDRRRLDLHVFRFLKERVGQLLNRFRHRRRKKHSLPFLRHGCKDGADVVNEAHVHHFIRFIQHQHLHVGQVDGAPLHVVHEAARRGDDDLRMLPQRPELAVDILTAVDRHRMDGQELRQMIDFLGRLHRQLSRGRQHHRLRRGPGNINALKNGNPESGRFPRAGLCLADEIPAGQRGGDRRLLDRRGFFETHILHRFQNLRYNSQFLKCFVHTMPPFQAPMMEKHVFLPEIRAPVSDNNFFIIPWSARGRNEYGT